MNLISRLCIVILFGTLACKDATRKQLDTGSLLQKSIGKMKLTDLNDQPVDLTNYKGKTVFINFWATWCKPCLEEMPSIKKAMDILKNENIEFLFASEETDEQLESFKAEHDYEFNFVNARNLEELNIVGLPTTFIFNAEGQLAFSEMGKRNWEEKENIDLILNIIKSK